MWLNTTQLERGCAVVRGTSSRDVSGFPVIFEGKTVINLVAFIAMFRPLFHHAEFVGKYSASSVP